MSGFLSGAQSRIVLVLALRFRLQFHESVQVPVGLPDIGVHVEYLKGDVLVSLVFALLSLQLSNRCESNALQARHADPPLFSFLCRGQHVLFQRFDVADFDSTPPSPLCKAHPFAHTLVLADAVEMLLSSPGHAAILGGCIARICREVHHQASTKQDSAMSREIGG